MWSHAMYFTGGDHVKKQKTPMKIIFLLLAIFSFSTWADEIKNVSELMMLPPYCRGTQQIRTISNDPTPIEQYGEVYGKSYYHLHHYCWALNSENKAIMMSNKYQRESTLSYALFDIKYVLDRSEPDFVLLPDIYNSQARILFTLHRDGEAVMALEKAIELKPDYFPAIVRLSDYYVQIGNKDQAIKTLETGIENSEHADTLIKKLAALGKTYQGTPGSARIKEQVAAPMSEANQNTKTPSSVPLNAAAPEAPTEITPSASGSDKSANDPYCRFCP